MTLIARKHSSVKQERLRRFVAEHVDALEPGLQIVEAGLRLGRTVVDLVAADARQTLVLISVGTMATERMLIGILDAYIWCLQFPDGLRRLCPDAPIAFTRPPRLVVVAEEVPEAFMELVGCLSFEVECHELAREPKGDVDTPAAAVEAPVPEALVAASPAPDPTPATPVAPMAGDEPVPVVEPTALEISPDPVVAAAAAATPVDSEAEGSSPEPGRDVEPAVTAVSAEPADRPGDESRSGVAPTPSAGGPGSHPHPGPIPAAPSPFSRNGRRIAPAVGRPTAGLGSPAANGAPAAGDRRESAGRVGGRGYVFAQAVRQPQPAGGAPATDEGQSGGEPRAAANPTPPPAAEAAATPEAKPESRETPRRPAAPDSLNFSSSGVSRQWQEFLARLANAQ